MSAAAPRSIAECPIALSGTACPARTCRGRRIRSIRGLWYERAFDAALLRPGTNTLTLTVPAGPVTGGVLYDYLRLELDETVR